MIALIVTCIALLGYLLWSRRGLYKLSWQMGGPLGLPIFGSVLEFGEVEDFLKGFASKTWKKYKSPCALWIGPILNIFVKDPATAQSILFSNDFLDKNFIYKPFEIILGKNSIISTTGETWKMHRKAADPAFNYQNLMRMIGPFNKAVNDFMKSILGPKVGKGEVDLSDDLIRLFGDFTVETSIGKNLNLICPSQNDDSLLDSLQKVQHECVHRSISIHLHSDFIFSFTKAYETIRRTQVHINSVLGDAFKEHPNPNADLRYTDGKRTLLDSLKKFQGKPTFTVEDINHDVATIIVASFETTSLTSFLVLFYMALYPEHQQKVFEELLSLYPEKNPHVNLDTLSDLVYTEMFINEVLRLHPPVPLIGRSASRDTRLNTGLFVPKGTQAIIDMSNLHRNPDVWGPNANEFNPENFSSEKLECLPSNAFMPFSVGPRNCAGIRLAKLTLKIITAKLVRTYQFRTTWKIEDVILVPGIITTMKNRPLIAFDERPK